MKQEAKKKAFQLYPGLHKIEDLVFLVNKSAIGKNGLHYQKLLKDWHIITGDIAKYTIPTKISTNRNKTTPENILYIATNNAAAATELVYQVNIIKEQINFYFGYPYIQQIKIIQSIFETKKVKTSKEIVLSKEQKEKAFQLVSEYKQNDEIKLLLSDMASVVASNSNK